MTALFYYLLKVVLCSGILFLYYHIALKNKMFHQWNRFYLLSAVVLSLLLPLLQFIVWHRPDNDSDGVKFILAFQSTDSQLEKFVVSSSTANNYDLLFSIGYSVVCLVLAIFFLFALLKIWRLVKSHVAEPIGEINFFNTAEAGTPFSFLRFLFWNKEIPLDSANGQQIFQHELVHIQEKHTIDKLFMEVVLIVLWCNPFFWLIRKELKFIHEFIADKKSVGQHGAAQFAAMVLSATYPQHYYSIINPFFQTSIKRRLAMLTKIQNPGLRYVSRIVALPLIAVTVFAFTVRTKALPDTTNNASPTRLQSFKSVADTFPITNREIKAVDVRTNDKKIKEIEIFYADGTNEKLTQEEAIKRKLINDIVQTGKKSNDNSPGSEQWIKASAPKPIYMLDEKEVTEEELSKINPSMIESINVLKDKPALDRYGSKGKNGVVEINLKATKSDGKIIIQENGKTIGSGKFEATNNVNEVKGNADVSLTGYISQDDNLPVFYTSEFPPSVDKDDWRRFLDKNLPPIIESIASKGAPVGTYVTEVQFIVEVDGSLSKIQVVKNPGYGLDKKILEFMKDSPKWKPAIQNGRAVRAYHKQPITLMISNS